MVLLGGVVWNLHGFTFFACCQSNLNLISNSIKRNVIPEPSVLFFYYQQKSVSRGLGRATPQEPVPMTIVGGVMRMESPKSLRRSLRCATWRGCGF